MVQLSVTLSDPGPQFQGHRKRCATASTAKYMFGSTVRVSGSAIEWHYFRFDQIQDGGSVAILEHSNGDISAKDHPIRSMFGARVGFSGSADRMALHVLRVGPNSIGMWEETMREE